MFNIYARWKPNQYTVTFNTNQSGVSAPASRTVTYGGTYGTLPTLSKGNTTESSSTLIRETAYTFQYWTLNGQRVTADTVISTGSNHTLIAYWTTSQRTKSYVAPTYSYSYPTSVAYDVRHNRSGSDWPDDGSRGSGTVSGTAKVDSVTLSYNAQTGVLSCHTSSDSQRYTVNAGGKSVRLGVNGASKDGSIQIDKVATQTGGGYWSGWSGWS